MHFTKLSGRSKVGVLKDILRRGRRFVKSFFGKDLRYRRQIRCPQRRLGSAYGGWWICSDQITPDSVVYSSGVGDDISFDLAMIDQLKVKVYAFDPTPRSVDWVRRQKLPDRFVFLEYGLAGHNGISRFYPPTNPRHVSFSLLQRPETAAEAVEVQVYTLATIMKMLGHSYVDVLKMNIEGAECDVIENLATSDIPVQQLLVEFHHRFPRVGLEKTRKAIEALNAKGFRIFSVSPNAHQFSFIST